MGASALHSDLISLLILVGLTGAVTLGYGFRVVLKGRARFDRVDRQTSSLFLGKPMMEMAHWSVEPLAQGLSLLKITPNQVSWSAFFFGALAGGALATGHFGIGAAFSLLAAFLDLLDGMLARLTGVASDAGEVLDAALDRYVEFFFIGGLVIYYRPFLLLQLLSLAALLGSFMVSYSTAKAEALGVKPPPGSMRRPERAVYLTFGAAISAATIFYEPVQAGFPPIGIPMVMALILVAVVSNISSVLRFVAIAKAIRARE